MFNAYEKHMHELYMVKITSTMVKLTKKVSLIFMAVIMCVTYTAYGSGVGSTNIKFGDPDEKKVLVAVRAYVC